MLQLLCAGVRRAQPLFLRVLSECSVSWKPLNPSAYMFLSNHPSLLRCMACHKPCQPIFKNPNQRNIQLDSQSFINNQTTSRKKKQWYSTYLHPLCLAALSFSGRSHWFWGSLQSASSEPMPWQSPSCATNSTAKERLSKRSQTVLRCLWGLV